MNLLHQIYFYTTTHRGTEEDTLKATRTIVEESIEAIEKEQYKGYAVEPMRRKRMEGTIEDERDSIVMNQKVVELLRERFPDREGGEVFINKCTCANKPLRGLPKAVWTLCSRTRSSYKHRLPLIVALPNVKNKMIERTRRHGSTYHS
jgi:hypothetical protein